MGVMRPAMCMAITVPLFLVLQLSPLLGAAAVSLPHGSCLRLYVFSYHNVNDGILPGLLHLLLVIVSFKAERLNPDMSFPFVFKAS